MCSKRVNGVEYGLDDLMLLVERVDQPQRDDLKKLIELYVEHGDLKDCPAACYYHASEPGGLVGHTVRVTKMMLKLREAISAETVSESDAVLAGVLHDISKNGIPLEIEGKFKIITRYKPNLKYNPNRKKDSYNRPFDYAPGQIEFQLATSAALIAARYIRGIGINVLQAIASSDGPTVSRSYYHKETPLALLLDYADRWSAYLETQGDRPSFSGVSLA